MTKWVEITLLLILAGGLVSGCAPSATQAVPTAVPPAATATQLAPLTPTVAVPAVPAAPTGAAPTPAGGTAAPGGTVKKGNVLLDFKGVSYDAIKKQAILNLTGSLPTPCHKLQTDVTAPDAQNRIAVSVYSLVDPAVMCVQVIKPFETAVSLGSLASGTYTVTVNGDSVGEVKVP
jgi:hypothetical protein